MQRLILLHFRLFFQLTLAVLLEFVCIALVHYLEKDLVVATVVLRPLCSAAEVRGEMVSVTARPCFLFPDPA